MKNKSSFLLLFFAVLFFSNCGPGRGIPTPPPDVYVTWDQKGSLLYNNVVLKHPLPIGDLCGYDLCYNRVGSGANGIQGFSYIFGPNFEQTNSVIKVTTVASGGVKGDLSHVDVFTKSNYANKVLSWEINHLSNPTNGTSYPQVTIEIKSGIHQNYKTGKSGYVVWSESGFFVYPGKTRDGTFYGKFVPETLGSIRLYKNGNFIIM